jgi:hypothetical protein
MIKTNPPEHRDEMGRRKARRRNRTTDTDHAKALADNTRLREIRKRSVNHRGKPQG